jgi:DNA-binding response OmpR family regulator
MSGAGRLAGKTVLIVEDEYFLADDASRLLAGEGAKVLGPFRDEQRGLEALAVAAPDCAILDINLGRGPAFELADALSGRGVKLLFATGYDREVIPARFADAVRLEKPISAEALLAEVCRLCGRA